MVILIALWKSFESENELNRQVDSYFEKLKHTQSEYWNIWIAPTFKPSALKTTFYKLIKLKIIFYTK